MEKLFKNAGKTIIETCSKLLPNEQATIITDNETLKIGKVIGEFAEKITSKVKFHVLEQYGQRPLNNVPKEVKVDVKESDVTYYAAQAKPGELQKFRGPLILLAKNSGREIHMPNINDNIMMTGMQADYYKIASLTFAIMRFAVKAKKARVTTPNGTNIQASFSNKIRWVPDTGLLWHKGMWGNLPAGEVFTCPNSIEGMMVVDGTLGDFFNEKYGDLKETPISIPIANSRAIVEDISCENKDLLSEFREYLRNDKNSNRVGEFACGTNIALVDLISNLLQDEKFPGVHIAFGSPYPQETGANWQSSGHVDGIMRKCSLWFDDIQIIKDGKFLEEHLSFKY
jgi:leucyl aminopeptidase (aminopeptidase T)